MVVPFVYRLQICACMGCKIDYTVLGVLVREVCIEYQALDRPETEAGAVGKHATLRAIQDCLFIESHDGTGVSFFHDSIQSAAYSLLETEEQSAFHLKLGRILKAQLPPLSKYLFAVANQLARGCDLLHDNERMDVLHIFLRAGDESKSAADFRGAHFFYAKAIGLVCSQGKTVDPFAISIQSQALTTHTVKIGCIILDYVVMPT